MSDGQPGWQVASVLGGRIAMAASALTVFGFFAWIVMPGLVEAWNQPASVSAAAGSTPGTPGWLDLAEAPARKGRALPPLDPAEVMTPRPQLVARGRDLFRKDCVSCHGEEGRGDGPAAMTLTPRPRNLTSQAGWTKGYRITDLYRTITGGVQGTGMAAFDYLTPPDRMALVHYVRSLGKFDHGGEDRAALDQLSAQFRSSGGRVPNRIPVSRAMAKLAAEAPPAASLRSPTDPISAALLRRFVADPDRAARTMAGLGRQLGLAELAQALALGAPANGFRPEVALLSLGDWQLLGAALGNQDAARPEG
jgi:mono/diheme cytochrome c family protein